MNDNRKDYGPKGCAGALVLLLALGLVFATIIAGGDTEVAGQPVPWTDSIGPIGSAVTGEVDDTEPAEETEPAVSTSDSDFLALTSAEIPTATDDDLLIAGYAVCATLDDDPAPDMAYVRGISLAMSAEFGWSQDQTGVVIGAAILAWCSSYTYLMQ